MNAPQRALPYDTQCALEFKYCRVHLDTYIQDCIETDPVLDAKVHEGVKLLQEWLQGSYYPSKEKRLQQLQIQGIDLEAMVRDIYTGIAYFLNWETFVSAAAQLAGRLNFDDKVDSITTMAEILAVLCNTDMFHIYKDSPQASLMLISNIPLPENLVEALDRAIYEPPMVCVPKPVNGNYQSGYLTFNDCVVLGKGNGHDGDLCLDVINTQNQIALTLDAEFLNSVPEVPNKPITHLEQKKEWDRFVRQSKQVYSMLINLGNEFWLTNKVDKRGRLYAQGYHVTSQGSSYKKAMLELAEKELVQGAPTTSQQVPIQ